MGIVDEGLKVDTAATYLEDDAKLWWKIQVAEIEAGRITIDTWEQMKEAMKKQFFPQNVEYDARRKLRELKHTGAIREYVKSFSACLLQITDMSEKDKFFTFMEGLKPWARNELNRQRVQDLAQAVQVAEGLVDFQTEPRKDKEKSTQTEPVQSRG